MKKKTNSKKSSRAKEISGEITWAILIIIARIPEALLGSFVDSKSFGGHELLADQLINNLRSMKQRGYIELKKINDSYSVRL
ncbi:MAG: hypothetical protein WCP91_03830, partial [Candidatus Berkelbacteria bacterium]